MRAPILSGQALRRLALAVASFAAPLVFAPALSAAESAAPRTAAGREAAAQALVEEALAAEVDGRDEDRAALLAKAEALAPELPAIHWHRGMILADGEWVTAEDAAVSSEARELLDEYAAQRDSAENSLAGHSAMARWCREKSLALQEQAHLTRMLSFNPDHAQARARLGYVRVQGEWIGREAIARAIAEEANAQAAMKKHAGALHDAARMLGNDVATVRERAAQKIRTVRDAEMIPALEAVASSSGEQASLLALEALAAMPEADASLSIARFAVLSPSLEVRQTASAFLKDRKLDDFVPYLVASMSTPVRTDFQIARRIGDKRIVLRQSFYRESMRSANAIVRDAVYVGSEPLAAPRERANNLLAADEALRDATSRTAMASAFALMHNSEIHSLNARLADVLETTTDMQFGADAQAWWNWWDQYEEVSYGDAKQFDVRYDAWQVRLPTELRREKQDGQRSGWNPVPGALQGLVAPAHACFAAGTPVLTSRGDVAIEQIRVGDLVLSQDVETGELAFKPVLDTTAGPSTEMLRVEHEAGSFRCTGGHPFWVSGEGWVNARRLTSGMELHTTTGSVRVSEVVPDDQEPTFNLIVGDFSTYFVGEARILCHDISPKESTDAIVPGLAQR